MRSHFSLVDWIKEFMQFGGVGAMAFVVDAGLFNLLQHGPVGFLEGHAHTANVVSASVATIFSWVANRLWTYRGRTQDNAVREAVLFILANVGGILITQFCLTFSHHVLGLTDPLSDNIAAYVVGFGLGTAFRFFFYHYIVFTGSAQPVEAAPLTGATPAAPADDAALATPSALPASSDEAALPLAE